MYSWSSNVLLQLKRSHGMINCAIDMSVYSLLSTHFFWFLTTIILLYFIQKLKLYQQLNERGERGKINTINKLINTYIFYCVTN